MGIRSKLMDKYFQTPEDERLEYVRCAMLGLSERIEQVVSSVEFELEYTLYYFAFDFELIRPRVEYQEFLGYLRRTKDVAELVPQIDADTSWGKFCKALIATQGEEGIFPIAYKFLVEYGQYYDINLNDSCRNNIYNRHMGGLHSLTKAGNFCSSLDCRRMLSLIQNISQNPTDRCAQASEIYKKAMELTDDTSFENIVSGKMKFSML